MQFGFTQSIYDYCLFLLNKYGIFLRLIVYVNDIIFTGNNNAKIGEVKQFLHKEFTIKDLSETGYFLGIQLMQNKHDIAILQQKFIHNILQETNMLDAKTHDTPFPTISKLSTTDGAELQNHNKYKRLIGKLLYLIVRRPDITFSIQHVSKFMIKPNDKHWKLAVRILKYLKGTQYLQLHFNHSTNPKLTTFPN